MLGLLFKKTSGGPTIFEQSQVDGLVLSDAHVGYNLRVTVEDGLSLGDEHVGYNLRVAIEDGIVLGDEHSRKLTTTRSMVDGLLFGDIHDSTRISPRSQSDGMVLGDEHEVANITALYRLYQYRWVNRYYCTVTGSSNGVSDITVPISSFSARAKTDGLTYVSAIVPDGETWAEAVADRADGDLRITGAKVVGGTIVFSQIIFEVDVDDIQTHEGVSSYSISIRGRREISRSGRVASVNDINYRSLRKGLLTLRSPQVDFLLRPGDTVIVDESEIYVKSITYTVSVGRESMVLHEGAGTVVSDLNSASIHYCPNCYNSLMTTTSGDVVGWGYNEENGINPTDNTSPWTDPTTVMFSNAVIVSNGNGCTHVIDMDRKLYGWGWNYFRQVNPASTDDPWVDTTTPILSNVVDVCAGSNFTIALLANGDVVGWGSNSLGAAQPGSAVHPWTDPTSVIVSNASKVRCGKYYVIAILNNGDLVGWGWNRHNNIHPDSEDDFWTDVTAVIKTGISYVACGEEHTMAIDMNKTLYGWGYNEYRQVNPAASTDDDWVDTTTPILSDVTAVACGYLHTMAILNNGDLVGWGDNSENQIHPTDNSNPWTDKTRVIMSDVAAVFCGKYFTIAVTTANKVFGWGMNNYRQANPRLTDDPVTNIDNPIMSR